MAADPASLDRLRDIVSPDPISWWPPAAAVWWLAALAGLWIGIAAWSLRQHRRREAYRRTAAAEIARLRARLRDDRERAAALYDLSRILKRTALAAFPRAEVAGLCGERWLSFLDRTSGGETFAEGDGRPLGDLASTPDLAMKLNLRQAEAVADAAARWVATHQRNPDEHLPRPEEGGAHADLRA